MKAKEDISAPLKKPYLVNLLALCFLFAPLGNIMIALQSAGVEQWYSPDIWWRLLRTQKTIDALMLFSIFCAGVALFIQKKTSWFFAILVLLFVTVNNIFFMENDPDRALSPWYIPLVLNVPVFVILFFFRYPYLDKRDHIIGGAHRRYKVKIPVNVSGLEGSFKIRSLSLGGCYIEASSKNKVRQVGDSVEVEWEDLKFSGTIAFQNKKGFGLKFSSPNKELKQKIKAVQKNGKS